MFDHRSISAGQVRRRLLSRPSAAAILTLAAPLALATGYPSSDYFVADWETRDAWKAQGFSFGVNYTASAY